MTIRTARQLTTVLAAAVLAGGMTLTAAAPALAAPAETFDGDRMAYFTHDPFASTEVDPTIGRFKTQHAVKDVRVTVAPFYPSPTDVDADPWNIPGETGPETDVPSAYDAELEAGYVDVVAQRRVLAEEGTAGAVFTLYVDGRQTSSIIFGADADLGDDVPGKVLAIYGPQAYDFPSRPEVDHQTHLTAPGSRMVYLSGNSEGDVPGDVQATMTVVEKPSHGTLVELPREGDPTRWRPGEKPGSWRSTVYVADEGFTGTDQAVFALKDEEIGLVRTLVVTFSIGDPRAADPHLGVLGTGLPFDEARVWEALKAQEGTTPAPAPSATTPAETVTPAPSATTSPAPTTPAADTDDHKKPETVETGDAQAWWLAGIGAAAAAGLVAARRRFGLAR